MTWELDSKEVAGGFLCHWTQQRDLVDLVCFQASTQPLAHNLLLRRLVVTMFSVLEAC